MPTLQQILLLNIWLNNNFLTNHANLTTILIITSLSMGISRKSFYPYYCSITPLQLSKLNPALEIQLQPHLLCEVIPDYSGTCSLFLDFPKIMIMITIRDNFEKLLC